MSGRVTYHVPLAAPQDLRTVDPRPVRAWDDEKAQRVVAVRVELRFGPDSEIARMLGLVAEPVKPQPTYRCSVCGQTRRGLPKTMCAYCASIATRGRVNRQAVQS